MMYFSCISANPSMIDPKHLAELVCTDGYCEHQYLWSLFNRDPNAKRDFLFRREQVNGWPRFYMISGRQPDKLDGVWNIERKEYKPKLQVGQKLAFSIRVNPVITRIDDDGKKKRHDVVMNLKKQTNYQVLSRKERPPLIQLVEQAGLEWLSKRAAKHGFSFEPKAVRIDSYNKIRTGKKRGNTSIRYSTLDFNGLLTVTDTVLFENALFKGIGPAKAFGCGLLLIRRI